METILISGGTGLAGTALRQALTEKGYRVIILTRDASRQPALAGTTYAVWNIKAQQVDEKAIAEADHIIHLAGAGVADKLWTPERKEEIVQSRVMGTKLLCQALQRVPNKVKTFVSASAIGWYGADPVIPNPAPFTEEAPADNSFLGHTCRQWEDMADTAAAPGRRVVKLRIGVVLSPNGGFQKAFTTPMKWGVAPVLAGGKQVISWIHIHDLVQLFIYAIENNQLQGVYNAVAPNPVSQKTIVRLLAKSRKRFHIPIPVPGFLVKWLTGELSIEVLKSTTVSAAKVLSTGYVFHHPALNEEVFRSRNVNGEW